jgi:uncharacterized protein YbjQ (UPF0145 family)
MRISSVMLSLAILGCGGKSQTARSPSRDLDLDGSFATRAPSQRLVVSPDHSCQPGCPGDHICTVLEVVDIHTRATSQDKGFDELRARAAALGADAVMDAEFEHGEGSEPSHLSGTIVRGCETIPPYQVIGAIDVESDPGSTDKGMAELHRRRVAMGGDMVIGITFEHGDNGEKGHLRGQVIRYTR